MTGSTLHIGYLKQPVAENIQCRNIMYEAKTTYEYINPAQDKSGSESHSRDSYERSTETIEAIENMYGCYSDNSVIKGMPKSIFGDRFGWDMQKDISNRMREFYEGKISEEDLKEYFEVCCSSMRLYRVQQRQTSGKTEDDNKQIVSEMYDLFAKENMRAAQYVNYREGETINSSYGGWSDDWTYYNADYYYKCEEMREKIRVIAGDMAAKWEISSFDTQEIEKNSKYTLDGGLDFNSGWNFHFRNQVGRSSLAKESVVPPKGFKMFFKESVPYAVKGEGVDSIGALEITIEKSNYKREFGFKILRTGLEGQIYSVDELIKEHLSKEDGKSDFIEFLSNFSVFTRWYSCNTGIVYKAGDYIPEELRK